MAVYPLTRGVGATPKGDGRIATPDAGSSNAVYQDVQLVLRYALRSSDMAEKFGAHGLVTGKAAVSAGLQSISFSQSFQQAPPCP
jgi:hypothetical protein